MRFFLKKMQISLLSCEGNLRGRWLCNTWLLHRSALRSFPVIFAGINKRKQDPLQDIKLSKQTKKKLIIQSCHYWTHHDLSSLPSSQMSSIISTQEGFEQERFIFKPLCQPQFQWGLNPAHLNQHQHFSPFTLSVLVISQPKYDRGRWTKNNLEMRHDSLRCWRAKKMSKTVLFCSLPQKKELLE